MDIEYTDRHGRCGEHQGLVEARGRVERRVKPHPDDTKLKQVAVLVQCIGETWVVGWWALLVVNGHWGALRGPYQPAST